MGGLGGTGGIHDADPDLGGIHSLDGCDCGPGLPDQRRRILPRQQEGEARPSVILDGQIAHHAGGEQIVFETGILDPRKRRGDSRAQFGHVTSKRLGGSAARRRGVLRSPPL